MATRRVLVSRLTLIVLALALCLGASRPDAQPAVSIDADDIGGVVTGKHGPEGGVWVIAETTELGTRFAASAIRTGRRLDDALHRPDEHERWRPPQAAG